MSNISQKPTILFFSRVYQAEFFPALVSEKYNSIYVTLNRREKKRVEEKGGTVVACLEDVYESLPEAEITHPYLAYSFGADRFLRGYTHQDRLVILRKCVAFWRDIFDKYKPSIVLHEVVAIEISEIMLLEAQRRNIKYLAFGAFSVGRSFYWYDVPFHSSMPERIDRMQPSELDVLKAREYIKEMREGEAKNPYIKHLKGNKDIRRLFTIIYSLGITLYLRLTKRNKIIREICYGYSFRYLVKDLSFYFKYILLERKYDDIDDVSKDFEQFFYPLHFEPEATLYYQSTFYENQCAAIENILKCLSENQVLMLKEHPAQSGFLMQKKFKELKKRFPNVMFIKADVLSAEMIKRAKAVITLVGTAGFEALSIGKPVILLGKIYYDSYEGVNKCETFEEVYNLVRGYKPFNESDDFENFLAKLIAMQKNANPWPNPELYTDENIINIKHAIEEELK